MKLANDQIWLYANSEYYRISEVEDERCTITKVKQAKNGEWIDQKQPSPRYPVKNFETSGSSWKYHTDVAQLANCPECNEEKRILNDDFLCQECRALMPVNCRMVADIVDGPVIVVLSGTETTLEFLKDGETILQVKREDLPEVAISTLKKFLG
jgi:hypothetical protein